MDQQHDQDRMAAFAGYGILDTPNEPEFDDIVRRAARLCDTPIALVSFVDDHRQWFKAKIGINADETPRSISFCTHAIKSNEVTVIPDASRDPRVYRSPLVTGDPHIRYYAGAPLRTSGGARLGTLCVIDSRPRALNRQQITELERLAGEVMALLERRAKPRKAA